MSLRCPNKMADSRHLRFFVKFRKKKYREIWQMKGWFVWQSLRVLRVENGKIYQKLENCFNFMVLGLFGNVWVVEGWFLRESLKVLAVEITGIDENFGAVREVCQLRGFEILAGVQGAAVQ